MSEATMGGKTATPVRRTAHTASGEISYLEQGEGPVALFVHGALVNAHLWRHQLGGLADIRRCIAVDMLAHGQTRLSAAGDVSSKGQAAMLAQLLDAIGVNDVDLVGNDGGGAVAQLFAVANPGRIRSLTLTNCDTHDNWPPEPFKPFVEMVAQGGLAGTLEGLLADKAAFRSEEVFGPCWERPQAVSDETIETYLRPHVSSPERLHTLERYFAAFDNAQTVAIEPQLRRLDVPTLVVWGDDDIFFDVKWGRWLKDIIPGAARLVELGGARLFFLEERPAAFNRELRTLWQGG